MPALDLKGGGWLIEAGAAGSTRTPEGLTEELRLIGRTSREFSEREVVPGIERLEQKDWLFARQLLRRAGELGLIGVDVPEEFGGVGLDKTAALVVSSSIAGSASFSATFGAHSNLAISPILYFGTADQKARYLPKLVSGEIVGAYALSEAGSGSDALGASARAVRLADGSFSLSGEKMWTTNGGFADLFIVFAKVGGEHFSAFIVERGARGFATGAEERKMGLHGSSTTPLILQDVEVPHENLLGEIGKGHKVAFNVLNFGRFKLGAMCLGGAQIALSQSARYAASRRQFGKPIASFGAIRHKLAEMTVQLYAVESLVYRTAGVIDSTIAGSSSAEAVLSAMEEFAVEASIAKVAGSEMLDFVLDENVQIHGGNGYVEDYPAERHYRDARVNRIFEGTNEINRLLIPAMLVRRALKGELPLIQAAKRLQDEVLSGGGAGIDSSPGDLRRNVDALRKVTLMVLGLAMQRYGDTLADEQEALMAIADMAIGLACAESAVLRAEAAPDADGYHVDAASIYLNDAALRAESTAKYVLAAMAEGDTLRTHLAALRRLLKVAPIDTVKRRRHLAEETVRRGGYVFQAV